MSEPCRVPLNNSSQYGYQIPGALTPLHCTALHCICTALIQYDGDWQDKKDGRNTFSYSKYKFKYFLVRSQFSY